MAAPVRNVKVLAACDKATAIHSREFNFSYDTRQRMLYVHLYFLKLFGLKIIEGKISINTKPFADAILHGRSHSKVYLSFGPAWNTDEVRLSCSDVSYDPQEAIDGQCAFAVWIQHIDNIWVKVIFAADG
jgi:hypothetical protein